MFFRKRSLVLIMIMLVTLLLAACGGSIDKKIVGEWKLVEEGEVLSHWEITKDKLTVKSESGQTLDTLEYTLTKTEDDGFNLKLIEESSDEMAEYSDMFDISIEGHFEDNDTIAATTLMGSESVVDFELLRIK